MELQFISLKNPIFYAISQKNQKMVNIKLRYFINIILGLSFLVVILTGVLKLHWLGLDSFIRSRLFAEIHDISGIVFVVFSVIHFILHINWYVAITKSLAQKPKYIQVR
jgi:hypothetical protein